jgi:hypothetical protein
VPKAIKKWNGIGMIVKDYLKVQRHSAIAVVFICQGINCE